LSVCPVCPVCDVCALWPNGWTDQDETWLAGRPRPWPHCFRWRPSSPSPKGHSPQIFCPYLLRLNGCMDQDVTWCGDRPRPKRLCVRWGPRSPSQKVGEAPKFSTHAYCGQTAGWMRLVLDMAVGLSPGNSVLDRDPTLSPKGGRALSPILGPFLLWPNGWMHQDATWYGGRPRPTRHCVRCGPSYPQKKGHSHPHPII